jgi:hypothetical protein
MYLSSTSVSSTNAIIHLSNIFLFFL